jgi:hypothetical protein
MSNKNFVVLGIPRSGTKFFCNTLSQISKIWIPPFRSFEPFNLKQISYSSQFFQSHLYDHDAIVKKMIDMKIEIMKKEIEIVTKETRMEEETA